MKWHDVPRQSHENHECLFMTFGKAAATQAHKVATRNANAGNQK
jgi:hypothetical protein